MSDKRFHASVEGRVQGVGFRYFTKENARKFNITGWVRNTYKGDVELIAEGSAKNIEKFLGLLRQGPSSAFVTDIKIEWQEANGEFRRFSIAPSH